MLTARAGPDNSDTSPRAQTQTRPIRAAGSQRQAFPMTGTAASYDAPSCRAVTALEILSARPKVANERVNDGVSNRSQRNLITCDALALELRLRLLLHELKIKGNAAVCEKGRFATQIIDRRDLHREKCVSAASRLELARD